MVQLFQCGKCSYKFETVKNPSRCPYCSHAGTLHKELSAQDLLDEIGNIEQDALGRV